MMLWLAMESASARARDALSDGACERLLLGVAQGRAEDFDALYRLTARSLYAFTLSLTRNSQDAQDAMMDTYLAIRTCAGQYRPQGKPLAWIFTIARNAVRMQQRRSGREAPLEDLPPLELADDSDPTAALALREALRILDGQEREIVLLHAVSGLKHREIAAMLGRPLSTVLSKYNRALRKLRRQLEAADEEVDLREKTK